jgi:hypothetical protein
MGTILVSWIGNTDLSAPTETARVGLGPIAQAVTARSYDEVVLLSDFPAARTSPYLTWLRSQTKTKIFSRLREREKKAERPS